MLVQDNYASKNQSSLINSVNELVNIRAKVKGILLRLELFKYMLTSFIQIT
jgi:hypothetical protein